MDKTARELRAAHLRLTLNDGQKSAVRNILRGYDCNYTLDGGPGVGKSEVLKRIAYHYEAHGIAYMMISIQRGPANVFARSGLNATSVAAFVKEPELDQSTAPSPQFKRAHTGGLSTPFVLIWDEYAFATSAQLEKVINCIKHITSGPMQLILSGDQHQLEPPSDCGLPIISHAIFKDRRRMRVCTLTDDSCRFGDDLVLQRLVSDLRDYETPFSAWAERLLQEQSYQNRFGRYEPETTLCMTNGRVRELNRAAWHAAADPKVVVTGSRTPRQKAPGTAPFPNHLVHGKGIIFVVNYWPKKDEECAEMIPNGTMGMLVSGPTGSVTATAETTFVVELEHVGAQVVTAVPFTTGEHQGYMGAPFQSCAAVTIAKLQGQTKSDITVDCTGCGRVELMVAISRGRRLFDGCTGIRIINYEPGTADRTSITPEVKRAAAGFQQLARAVKRARVSAAAVC